MLGAKGIEKDARSDAAFRDALRVGARAALQAWQSIAARTVMEAVCAILR